MVEISLTKKGLENYEKVAEAVFQYAQRIREAGPQEYIYKENNDLGKIKFEFQDKVDGVDYCVHLSSKMQHLEDSKMDQLLRSNFVIDVFDHKKLNSVADVLVDPTKSNIILRS